MNLTDKEILTAIYLLGIDLEENQPSSNGWIQITCPSADHKDDNPSCGINLNNGVVHCFGCGLSTNILKLYQYANNFETYKEALDDLNSKTPLEIIEFLNQQKEQQKDYTKLEPVKINKAEVQGILIDFNPEDFYYTKVRGFTKEFCKQFNIRRCISGYFSEYFIIPIQDTKKDLHVFEARKLQLKEYLEKFFNYKVTEFKVLNDDFENIKSNYGLKLDKYGEVVVHNESILCEYSLKSLITKYILRKKVLYPNHCEINKTIFNIDNLNFNEPLYVTEGVGSIPKLMSTFGNNVTCVFGAETTCSQLIYLNKFKKIILIPDNDNAGKKMVETIWQELNIDTEINVLSILSDDSEDSYENELRTVEPIIANKWLVEQSL